MAQMPFHLSRGDEKEVLQKAGYFYRKEKNDYIRNDTPSTRYHVKRIDRKTMAVHIDLTVEGKHWSPFVPVHLKEEITRIHDGQSNHQQGAARRTDRIGRRRQRKGA